jgi:hypothetical protein
MTDDVIASGRFASQVGYGTVRYTVYDIDHARHLRFAAASSESCGGANAKSRWPRLFHRMTAVTGGAAGLKEEVFRLACLWALQCSPRNYRLRNKFNTPLTQHD